MKTFVDMVLVLIGTFALFLSMYRQGGAWWARCILFVGSFGMLLYASKRLGDDLFRRLFFFAAVILLTVMVYMIFF